MRIFVRGFIISYKTYHVNTLVYGVKCLHPGDKYLYFYCYCTKDDCFRDFFVDIL